MHKLSDPFYAKDLIDFVNFSDNNALNTYIKQENDFCLLCLAYHYILDFL